MHYEIFNCTMVVLPPKLALYKVHSHCLLLVYNQACLYILDFARWSQFPNVRCTSYSASPSWYQWWNIAEYVRSLTISSSSGMKISPCVCETHRFTPSNFNIFLGRDLDAGIYNQGFPLMNKSLLRHSVLSPKPPPDKHRNRKRDRDNCKIP